jgi:hypothetical protein
VGVECKVVFARNMPYVYCEIGDKFYMVELPRREFIPLLLEGVDGGLVVGEDDEVARFQYMAEMFYGLVDDQ